MSHTCISEVSLNSYYEELLLNTLAIACDLQQATNLVWDKRDKTEQQLDRLSQFVLGTHPLVNLIMDANVPYIGINSEELSKIDSQVYAREFLELASLRNKRSRLEC